MARPYRVTLFAIDEDGYRTVAITDTYDTRSSLKAYREFQRIGRAYVRDGEWKSWSASRHPEGEGK